MQPLEPNQEGEAEAVARVVPAQIALIMQKASSVVVGWTQITLLWDAAESRASLWQQSRAQCQQHLTQ